MVEFVPVTHDDLGEIAEIYNYYVENSTATFHSRIVSGKDLEEFLLLSHPRYPSFLIREGGETIGYCVLSRYKNREAYDRSAELSIYLTPEYTGRGIGPIALLTWRTPQDPPGSMCSSEPSARKTVPASG